MLSETQKSEIHAYLRKELESSKEMWARRSPEGRAMAHEARKNGPKTWRHMKGLELMVHEAGHVGNRPFVTGLLVIAAGCFYLQTTFSDEMKKESQYWSTFHAKDDKH